MTQIYTSLVAEGVSQQIAAREAGRLAIQVESRATDGKSIYDQLFADLAARMEALALTNNYLAIARVSHSVASRQTAAESVSVRSSTIPGETQRGTNAVPNPQDSKFVAQKDKTPPAKSSNADSSNPKSGKRPTSTTEPPPGPNQKIVDPSGNGDSNSPDVFPNGTTNQPSPKTLQALFSTNTSSFHAYFDAGSYLLNPYRIDYATNGAAFLRDDGVDAKFFVEFVYNDRWVMTPERFSLLNVGESDWLFFNDHPFDFQGRITYVVGDEKDATASAIVGSGNFSAEFSVGLNLWRKHSMTNRTHAVSFEVSYGAVSDRSVFDVHHRGFLGLGYLAGYSYDGRMGNLVMRFGMANVETVRFKNDVTSELWLKHGRPDFESHWGPAIEAEAFIPIVLDSYLTLGARAYGNADANQIAVWIGFTRKGFGWDTH